MRPTTEWVEILETENGLLVDADTEKIIQGYLKFKNKTGDYFPEIYGNGKASERILQTIYELAVLKLPLYFEKYLFC